VEVTHAIRLLVSDIDSTLVWRGMLPPANTTALNRIHQQGVQVVLATVRKFSSAKEISDLLGFACPLICEGGATTYDVDGTCVAATAIDADVMRQIATIADDAGIPLLLTSHGVNFATAGAIQELTSFDVDTHQVATAMSVVVQQQITRLIVAEPHHVEALAHAIAHLPVRIARHYNRAGVLDDAVITHPDATMCWRSAMPKPIWRWSSMPLLGWHQPTPNPPSKRWQTG
jgi:HAD superfamily hydrolase (TIGR01484 family)